MSAITALQADLDVTNAALAALTARVAALEGIAPPLPIPSGAKLLFASGFEGSVALTAPSGFFGTGCWQDIVGSDGGDFSWPPNIWGGSTARFQMIVGLPGIDSTNLGNYMGNNIIALT